MAPWWIDSHCHIQDRYQTEGVDAAGAVEAGETAGVAVSCASAPTPSPRRQAVELVSELPRADRQASECGPRSGLHPHEASMGESRWRDRRRSMRSPRRGSRVGGRGGGVRARLPLRPLAPAPTSARLFAAQIDLAKRHGLALVVHTREAWDDTFDILGPPGLPERTVVHCFTGGPDEARRCLDLGAYLSFSGIVTFKSAPEVREAAALCPLDRLLVETDAPFLAPVPHRGEPNEPAWVAVVGEAVAEVRGRNRRTSRRAPPRP